MDAPDDPPGAPPRPVHETGPSALAVARAVVEILSGSSVAGALATVVARAGSAPQVVGARLLLLEDGRLLGTVGGGAIEAQVLDACRQVLRDGGTRMVTAHLVRDLGMCCGGSMQVFVEHLQRQLRLTILGAGHLAQAVAPMARAASFAVRIVDDREDLLEHPAFADCTTLAYDVDELATALPDLGPEDYVLVMTRDHARDESALAHLLCQPHRYLGMIGSRRKVWAILRRIRARAEGMGRPPPSMERLRAPVGLALGGRTPGEIAVSILAELLACRHAGEGRPMSIVDEVEADARDREP